jgi:hypothetical protein
MLDERAEAILAAGREALPRLPEFVGEDAEAFAAELAAAIERVETSWQAEAVRDVLRRTPATRKFLEERVPDARSPRPFGGAAMLRNINPPRRGD